MTFKKILKLFKHLDIEKIKSLFKLENISQDLLNLLLKKLNFYQLI